MSTPAVTASTNAARSTRCDQMAKAASAGLMSHPDVECAIVSISGEEPALTFHLTCAVKAGRDPSDLMETVSRGVVPNVERMLGTVFAARDLSFRRCPADEAAT